MVYNLGNVLQNFNNYYQDKTAKLKTTLSSEFAFFGTIEICGDYGSFGCYKNCAVLLSDLLLRILVKLNLLVYLENKLNAQPDVLNSLYFDTAPLIG